ncbi:MAG: protecting protein DprA [Clostridiales bacterium]|jgi:DNA processing protein|nr:protecting protein DprA [Clostridiales bacterium]
MNIEREGYWYWFNNIDGIGRKKQQILLDYFEDVEEIWKVSEDSLKEIKALSSNDVASFVDSRNAEKIKKDFEMLKKWKVEFLSIENKNYPTKLKNIYDYPYGIYYSGNYINNDTLSIAVIGARNCSEYGIELATYFGRELSKAGVQVISGLARGIDTYAHKGALMSNGNTIGVLGTGIDICYPEENIKVMEEMLERGGILSEYNLGVQPRPGHFPMRNRIISALVDGIVVIEARKRSGSLITANIGLEHGKDIFAVPGRAFDKLSEGTNAIIKAGAKITTKIEDVLEEYFDIEESDQFSVKSRIITNQLEKTIYNILDFDPKCIDELEGESKLPIGQFLQGLLSLEIHGAIRKVANSGYVKIL